MQKRIYRAILLTVAAAALLLGAAGVFVGYNVYRASVEDSLKSMARVCGRVYEQGGVDAVTDALGGIGGGVRFTYIDEQGNVVADSSGNISENHSKRPEVAAARETGAGGDTRVSSTLGKNMYYYAVKTGNGVLRLSVEYRNMLNILFILIPVIFIAASCIFMIATIVSVVVSENLTMPIKSLSKQISAINLNSSRFESVKTDCKELLPIAENVERMAERISRHLEEVARTSEIRREFTANVSHELRTPLTTIQGFADMTRSGMITDPAETAHIGGLIYNESERLLKLINDIIELSRIEENGAKELQLMPLDDIAGDTVDIMREKAVAGGVHLHLSAVNVTAEVNAGYIKEMLINLIDNAIKYNKPDGNVWVKIDNAGGCAEISVKDDGMGIPREEQERIFERFYRSPQSRALPGTGLGLSIVKHIAEYHNADIDIVSEPDHGTEIKVKIKTDRSKTVA